MNRSDRIPPLAWGLIAGFVLSVARAPLGIDLVGTPVVEVGNTFLFRGLALLVIAVGLGRLHDPRPKIASILWGSALGYGLHALVIGERFALAGRGSLYLFAIAALVALWMAGKRREEAASAEDAPDERVSWVERTAYLIAGGGLALSLESIARPLRLLTGGLPADEAVLGSVFLFLLAFSAAAFGPLIPRRFGAPAYAALLALAALASLESLRPLSGLSSKEGLALFLAVPPWRLDVTHVGRLSGDALIGARVLVLPAFALGTALAASRLRARLAWTVFGAALAVLVMPALLKIGIDHGEAGAAAEAPALRAGMGLLLAGFGGLVVALGARGSSLRTRAVFAVLCLAASVFGLMQPSPRVLPLSPWERHPVLPRFVREIPEGLLTVEPTLDLGLVATLDRRRLSPTPALEASDTQRLQLSWERAVLPLRDDEERRVLLVGQLTPARARELVRLGATHVDRTGAWHEHMQEIEALLFDDLELPPGRILAPGELDDGTSWVLVVVPPVEGPAPRTPVPDDRRGPAVVWVSSGTECTPRDWGGFVRLSSQGPEELCLAVHQSAGIPAGKPARARAPWRQLTPRSFEREAGWHSAAMQRLARAARGGQHEALTAGLALFSAAQVRSSPFETYAQKIEIDPEALKLLRESALAHEPDVFQRDLWSSLATILAEKRELELIQENLEPLAARWEPWWELEIALARADLESLDPASAAERLLVIVAQRPLDIRMRILCADALSMAQRPAEAAHQLREADAMQPGRRDVRRRLAMALARAQDEGARALVDELLEDDPADEELRAFQGPGPYPPVEIGYTPYATHAPGDDHDDE